MKQSEIEHIIEKRFEKINAAFDKVRMHLNEDDIRLFRVKVKKLKACLRLIDAEKDHSDPIRLPQKIEKNYQLSGKIRTLQMQQNHVQKTLKGAHILPPVAYLKLISDQILQHILVFNKHITGTKYFKKDEEKVLALLPKQLSQKTAQQFIRSEGAMIEKLFLPVFLPDISFHEVRRILKNLLYISPYLEMDISVLSPYSVLSTYENIDAFTIILGGFHDIDTAIDYLHTACKKIEIDENEKAVLRSIEILWIKEREVFRKKIYDEIEKITASGRPAESLVNCP